MHHAFHHHYTEGDAVEAFQWYRSSLRSTVHVEWCHPVAITENCGMHLDSNKQNLPVPFLEAGRTGLFSGASLQFS